MKIIYTLALLLLSTISFSQITIPVVNSTDSVNCNGYATFTDSLVFTSWEWYQDGSLLQNNGGILYDLCPGNYILYANDTLAVIYDSATFVIGLDNSCNGFSTSLTITNAYSIDGDCQGSISSSVTGGTAPFSYLWNSGATTTNISDLCSGDYELNITDVNGCIAYGGPVSIIDSSSAINNSLEIDLNTTNSSADGACDGSIYVQVNGGLSPYSYSGTILDSLNMATDLCAGFYSITVTDALDDSTSLTYLITSPSTTITNVIYPDSTIVDTLLNEILTNCTINYQSVDSATVNNISYPSLDSVDIEWIVYYSNGLVDFIYDSYNLTSGIGTYNIVLNVFCPNKTTDNFLQVSSQIYYSLDQIELNKIDELRQDEISIYPNPFHDNLTISIDEINTYHVSIYDLSGKLILSDIFTNTNLISLDLKELNKGQYVVKIENNTTVITRKITK